MCKGGLKVTQLHNDFLLPRCTVYVLPHLEKSSQFGEGEFDSIYSHFLKTFYDNFNVMRDLKKKNIFKIVEDQIVHWSRRVHLAIHRSTQRSCAAFSKLR